MTVPAPAQAPEGLSSLGRLIVGYRAAKAVFAAASLDVFSRLDRPRTAEEAAAVLDLDARALGILLDALAGLGFLKKQGGRYRNSETARRYLCADSPEPLLHNLRTQDRLWEAWGELPGVLRTGAPRAGLLARLRDPRFTRDYILGMREIAARPAREVALSLKGTSRFLDIGCGPGSFSLALLEACPGSRAVLLDLPGTLEVTRSLVPPRLRPRVSYLAGDYHSADLGQGRYDLVLLSHVTHDEGEAENRALIARAAKALRPKGRLAVHDFVVSPDGAAPLFSALFAVHMLVYTERGRSYSEAAYRGWMQAAGLAAIRAQRICAGAPNESVLITGVSA